MRLVGSDSGLKELQVNEGKVVPRSKDGTFHVDGADARSLVKSGDFAVAGITFRNATGYKCTACNFVGLYRDKCGKCGCTELTQEEE
jgi:hypothetical protein